ncbi:hypothetical protein AOLI_G00045230 [Acnodon oligacanthus]
MEPLGERGRPSCRFEDFVIASLRLATSSGPDSGAAKAVNLEQHLSYTDYRDADGASLALGVYNLRTRHSRSTPQHHPKEARGTWILQSAPPPAAPTALTKAMPLQPALVVTKEAHYYREEKMAFSRHPQELLNKASCSA